jgi:multisubunit Na+/H+ antiporter MnhC subunit
MKINSLTFYWHKNKKRNCFEPSKGLIVIKIKRKIMPIIELLILTIILILIAVLALSVRLIFTKKGEFRGGSCQTHSNQLHDQGIGCGCGNNKYCKTIY